MLEKADKELVQELKNLFDNYCYTLYNKHFPFTENNIKKYITEVYQNHFKDLKDIKFTIDEFQITINFQSGLYYCDEIINYRQTMFHILYDCKNFILKLKC